ncbi:MAG: hypothetical protein NXI31_05560 [bacterium]|nr:hypothetical protein [bacterium]
MTRRDLEIDRITTLLSQCLGRIDEQAFRLQQLGEGEEDFDAADVLDEETALLQSLVSSALMAPEPGDGCHLNAVVEQTVRNAVTGVGIPVVVRQNLADDLPRVAVGQGEVGHAVQRALMLVLSAAEAGDELAVTTRLDQDRALLEIEGPLRDEEHLDHRRTTLGEFIAELGGKCHVAGDGHQNCLIAIELPPALVTGS